MTGEGGGFSAPLGRDFDGCRRACRRSGRHTLEYGACEQASPPEPVVMMSKVYTESDGERSTGFDTYTLYQLAALIEPSLKGVVIHLGPNALDAAGRGEPLRLSGAEMWAAARQAAHAIIHRNDAEEPGQR